MRETPFNKIRNLGGKLGNEVVEDLSIQNASELWYELGSICGSCNCIYTNSL